MNDAYAAGLARLRERFRERAARDAARLDAIAETLETQGSFPHHRDELRRIAHGLLGTAATLGFARIGARARDLEEAVLKGAGASAWADRCRALAGEIAAADEPAAAPAAPSPSKTPGRIVGILDQPDSGLSTATLISNLGYKPILADPPEGDDAWADRDDLAAILITDAVDDPLGRASALSDRAPLILVTQDRSFAYRLAAARAGVDAVLSRPIDVGELGDWLESFSGHVHVAPPSVMIVDDERLAAEAHAAALRSAGIKVTIVSDPETALERVTASYPDLMLLDMQMPGVSGIELARVIRLSRRHLSLPIVFLSAERDPALQLEARQIGGDDFIVKPVDPQRLVTLVQMRAERAVALRSMMERDSLTGLLNHARFKDRLAHEFQRSRRNGGTISVAMIDLDHFKRVNDSYGHMTGDRVLRALAHSLVAGLRRTDVIGRYGGEEFGVILLDSKPGPALAAIEKVRKSFCAIEFDGGGRPFSSAFSAGIAGCRGHAQPEALIAAADRALYEAKSGGRNRTVLAQVESPSGHPPE